MYWQKRFDRENPDIELEEKIHEIHKRNKDYGYRRMCGELRNQGYIVNKKKVQRIMQKYNLQVMWVNDFQIDGPDALRPHKKGCKKTLGTSNKKLNIEQDTTTVPVDTSTEHVKELEDEILKLRIENAYLKELRRLRLEEEALLKKQRESSTASGENSN